MNTRIAVLGDLSGHLAPLLKELETLGIHLDGPRQLPTGIVSWPDDLVVVQVGDLVHKGPNSLELVALVHDVLLPSGRWVQLLGNHESQYLPNAGTFFWRKPVEHYAADALRTMWSDGRLRPAAAIDDVELGPVLITHAGMTPTRYVQARRNADRHDDVDSALPEHARVAAWLNLAPADGGARRAVTTAGMMLGCRDDPGVVWTEPRAELRLPWLHWEHEQRVTLPFSQVHGHANPLMFTWKRPPRVPDDLAGSTVVERPSGHVVTTFQTDDRGRPRRIVGIDPGANAKRAARPRALLLSGTLHGHHLA